MNADEAHDDLKSKQQLIEELKELRHYLDNTSLYSERNLHNLISNIPDVVWTTDEDAHTVFISNNLAIVYGYTPEEIYQDGVFSDITKRKSTEKDSQESRAFNEILLNSTPDIIYIYDIIEKKNVYING